MSLTEILQADSSCIKFGPPSCVINLQSSNNKAASNGNLQQGLQSLSSHNKRYWTAWCQTGLPFNP